MGSEVEEPEGCGEFATAQVGRIVAEKRVEVKDRVRVLRENILLRVRVLGWPFWRGWGKGKWWFRS